MKTNDILTAFANATSGIMKTNKGKKESIYKDTIYPKNATESEKKSIRTKYRKIINNICKTIIAYNESKDTKNVEKVANAFIQLYKESYLLNDFSVNSLCSENTESEKKENIKKMLTIVKKYNK